MSTKETVFEVRGMSCGGCVRHVEGALKKLEGVTAVEVTIGRARVQHDPEKATAERMIAAIDDAGYESNVA